MSLQLETKSTAFGFSARGSQSGVYHCLNMFPTYGGLSPFLKLTQTTSNTSIATLTKINWFAEQGFNTFGVSDTGKIFKDNGGWSLVRTPSNASHGNGMVGDQKGRLLYAQDRWLGFSADGVNFTDSWKDLVSTVIDRPMDTFEDWVIIGNGNKVALLNITDDSLNLEAFTLPDGFSIQAIKANRTGILIGANLGSRSVVVLWNAEADRSITPWIWKNSPLRSICTYGDEWIVTTAKEVFITDGYTTKSFAPFPDTNIQDYVFNPLAGGTAVTNNLFLLANTDTGASFNRRKSGLLAYDLASETWLLTNPTTQYDLFLGAVYESGSGTIHVSYATPSTCHIATLSNAIPSSAHIISEAFGDGVTQKTTQGIKVGLAINPQYQLSNAMSFTISAKVYDFSRPLWGYAVQTGTGAALNQITVNGTSSGFNNAQIGDEVTILSGDNAGQVRHITAITNQNTSSETWTLDANLPGYMANNDAMNVMPFKKVHTYTYTNIDRLVDVYFNCQTPQKGKKYLVKILLENLSAPLTIPAISLLYDDLGII